MNSEPRRKGDIVSLTDGTLTEQDARAMLERIRWPDGVHCIFPDCGGAEVYRIETAAKEYTRKDGSKRAVGGRHLFKCKACRRQFSVTKGTIFEDSKIPLRTWIMVMYRMCSSKKGVSAHQIHREFGISYESAWFMCHRIRWAMRDRDGSPLTGTIEADETYVGGKQRGHIEVRRATMTQSERVTAGMDKKTPVFGILERGGRVRAQVISHPTKKAVQAALHANVDMAKSRLMTDESKLYNGISAHLPHQIIRHNAEYVRGDIYTNGIEGFWSILKRGVVGTFHHVDAAYLDQYVTEFAYRYNSRKGKDAERFTALMGQVEGRLGWYLGEPS